MLYPQKGCIANGSRLKFPTAPIFAAVVSDEIGTPFCITVDYDSLKKKDVTVRVRDTMKQERVKIDKLCDYLYEKFVK